MKRTIIFLFLLFFVSKVEAKKLNYPIEVIAGSAELIVLGEIEMVKGDIYIFNISETLKGEPINSVSVEMFKEWECDKRFVKPQKGQKLCLFLRRGLKGWKIINGSSGELIISNNMITLGSYEEFKHRDSQFTPYQLPLEEFRNGIVKFCKCFEFIGEYGFGNEKAHFKQIASDKQISKFKESSDFSSWILEKMKKYQVEKT